VIESKPVDRIALISDRYGRFYAPFAVVSVLLAFLPLFDAVGFGSVFDMARSRNGDPAVFGILLLGVLVTLLTVAALRVRSPLLPAATAFVAGLILLMLLSKPGAGDPPPDLSGSGRAGVVIMIAIIVASFAHAIHLLVAGWRPPATY